MKITRDTIRADGLTVGQALDRDAAELRTLGHDVKNGCQTYDERLNNFKDRAREEVLNALDVLALELTGNVSNGPKDGELGALFVGVDLIATRIFNKSLGL